VKLSLIPLLLTGESISREVRKALLENRLQDAAKLLVQKDGLSWIEASQLLDVPVCREVTPSARNG
jgi:hypothetical protein